MLHIYRTAPLLIVDDESELEHLHKPLEDELEKPYYNGRVRIVRNKEREGLIRSRNNGAIAARGEVRPDNRWGRLYKVVVCIGADIKFQLQLCNPLLFTMFRPYIKYFCFLIQSQYAN